jgi:hypothetical protein
MNLSVSHWRDAEPATTAVAVQDGARDAVLWRLANMDRGDRAVLEAAAVAGLSFTSADVMMALAANVPGVPACLDRLAARGLIRRDDAAAGAASPSYCFWHPLHAELVAGGAPGFDILRASSNLSARRTRRVEIA